MRGLTSSVRLEFRFECNTMLRNSICFGIILAILLSGYQKLSNRLKKKDIAYLSPPITQGQSLPVSAIAKIGDAKIELEVARTSEQKEIGLMFRDCLDDNRGMWFPFENQRRGAFWMRNVPIALDLILLDGDRIVALESQLLPCTTALCPLYEFDVSFDSAIELKGGRAKELGLEVGDLVSIVDLYL